MDHHFDDLAKELAREDMPRRRILGRLFAAVGGGVVAVVAGEHKALAEERVKCPPGLANCNDLCRDTSIDPDHCGGCRVACGPGQMCRAGVCVACTCSAPCPPGQTSCNGACVNLASDPQHCGSCSAVCQPGQTCSNGACVTASACTPDATRSCYTGPAGTQGVGICHAGTQTCLPDGGGWGACSGQQTPVSEICGNGLDDDCDGVVDNGCCPAGQTSCGGVCVNTMTDPANCGACGHVCGAPNAASSCAQGTCGIAACNPGFVNCNGNGVDGCECQGNACCGSSCQTKHSNGLGQNFYDCTASGTYNQTQANEAAQAWSQSGALASTVCGTGTSANAVSKQTATQCAVWAFGGTAAGHVVLSNGACVCPAPTDPTWS